MNLPEIKCQLCGKEFSSYAGLHGHLSKAEKLSQEDYYIKFFPRFDLRSGKPIPFKNFDDYVNRKFVDKRSEFSYIKENGFVGESREILLKQLKVIKTKTNYFPGYVEWRSSKNIRYDWMYKGGFFYEFENAALTDPSIALLHKESFNIEGARKLIVGDLDCDILVDTREQKPLFDGKKTSINVGDYTFSAKGYNSIHVDRKSQADFISTFTSGLERFKKECKKAQKLGITLVVLIESSFSDCFNYKPLRFTGQRVTGDSAFNGVRRIIREYGVDFLFVNDRIEAKQYVKKILSNKDLVLNYDLQFLYELGEF